MKRELEKLESLREPFSISAIIAHLLKNGVLSAIVFITFFATEDIITDLEFIKSIPLAKSEWKKIVTFLVFTIATVRMAYQMIQKKMEFDRFFKNKIVAKVIKQTRPGWKFSKVGHSLAEFRLAKLVDGFSVFSSEDMISGQVNGAEFRISEVLAQKRVKQGKSSRLKTVFRGFFITLPLAEYRKGETYILPDLAEKHLGILFGKFLQDINISRPDVVKLENPAFEKEFVVYSSDSFEAHFLLNPLMMERLISLKRTLGEVAISMKKGRAYIALRYRRNLFEPNYMEKNGDKKIAEIKKSVEVLEALVGEFAGQGPLKNREKKQA